MGSSASCCKKKSKQAERNKILQQGSGRAILTTEAHINTETKQDIDSLKGSCGDEELALETPNKKSKILKRQSAPRTEPSKGAVYKKAETKEKVELTANFLFSMTFSNFYKAPIMERQKEESSSIKEENSEEVSSEQIQEYKHSKGEARRRISKSRGKQSSKYRSYGHPSKYASKSQRFPSNKRISDQVYLPKSKKRSTTAQRLSILSDHKLEISPIKVGTPQKRKKLFFGSKVGNGSVISKFGQKKTIEISELKESIANSSCVNNDMSEIESPNQGRSNSPYNKIDNMKIQSYSHFFPNNRVNKHSSEEKMDSRVSSVTKKKTSKSKFKEESQLTAGAITDKQRQDYMNSRSNTLISKLSIENKIIKQNNANSGAITVVDVKKQRKFGIKGKRIGGGSRPPQLGKIPKSKSSMATPLIKSVSKFIQDKFFLDSSLADQVGVSQSLVSENPIFQQFKHDDSQNKPQRIVRKTRKEKTVIHRKVIGLSMNDARTHLVSLKK